MDARGARSTYVCHSAACPASANSMIWKRFMLSEIIRRLGRPGAGVVATGSLFGIVHRILNLPSLAFFMDGPLELPQRVEEKKAPGSSTLICSMMIGAAAAVTEVWKLQARKR